MTDKVQKIREEVERLKGWNNNVRNSTRHMTLQEEDFNRGKHSSYREILDFIDSLQEGPVSTKDKLLALSDGRLHLGWIDDAKVVEFEECLMQFHEDMNNIPQGTDSLTRLKDTDGVLHSYSKKLMSMAKEEPVSEDNNLRKASEEYLKVLSETPYNNTPITNAQTIVRELITFLDIPSKYNPNHIEEPVSEDLEEAAFDYAEACKYEGGEKLLRIEHFKAGAKWLKSNLWKPADGDDLPDIDREVIALLDNGKVVFAHRPPEYWDGKNIATGKVTRNYPKTYDKGGWNIPNVKYWLDVKLPKEIEL